MKKRVAIIIGHRSKAQGAYSAFLDITEYEFNKKVAAFIKKEDCVFHQPEIDVFERPNTPFVSEGYRIKQLVNNINASGHYDLVISLHFNSFSDEKAHGVTALHYLTNNLTKKICTNFVNKVSKRFGVKRRALIPVSTKNQNGGLLICAVKSPTILLEPFFGSNKSDCNAFYGKECEYAQLIKELISEL